MTIRFDARAIPVADREEVVRAMVSRTLAPLEIDFMADRGSAATSLAITDLTELTVWCQQCQRGKLDRHR